MVRVPNRPCITIQAHACRSLSSGFPIETGGFNLESGNDGGERGHVLVFLDDESSKSQAYQWGPPCMKASPPLVWPLVASRAVDQDQ